MKDIDIAIPVLNEEKHLPGCLDSVLAFEKPSGVRLSIYVLDGGSSDGTKRIAAEYAVRNPSIQVLNNPGKLQACAVNIVLKNGTGEYVMRLDAHATYPSDYLALCLQSAVASDADNVGGIVKTVPGAATYAAKVVQAITTHRFGVGNAEFRLMPEAGPVDTVPFGFFKRSIFKKIGFYDERLASGEDYELNRRIRAIGGRVWLNPRIVSQYYNRPTIAGFLRKQLMKQGPYNAFFWYLAPYARAYRHGVTALFVAGVISGIFLSFFSSVAAWSVFAVIALYALLATTSAFQQAFRYRCARHVIVLPFMFLLFHLSHGLGALWGVMRLIVGSSPVQTIREPWPGAGRYRAWPVA